MIHIIICDDHIKEGERIREYCDRLMKERWEYQTETLVDGEEILRKRQCDILILDIELPGMSGIEVKNVLQKQKPDTRILFLSAHSEQMPEAFGWNVCGFLEKPVSYEKFAKYMSAILQDIQPEKERISFRNGREEHEILLRDIKYLRADGKYVDVFLRREAMSMSDEEEDSADNWQADFWDDRSLGFWENELENKGFLRTDKSHIVNMNRIDKMNHKKGTILFDDKSRLRIPRKRKQECWDIYAKYLRRKMGSKEE